MDEINNPLIPLYSADELKRVQAVCARQAAVIERHGDELNRQIAKTEYEAERAGNFENDLERQAEVIAKMREALDECEVYFDNRCDVVDGDYGPAPNAEMRLLPIVRAALALDGG